MPYSYFQPLEGRLSDRAMSDDSFACGRFDFSLFTHVFLLEIKNTHMGVAGGDFQWPAT